MKTAVIMAPSYQTTWCHKHYKNHKHNAAVHSTVYALIHAWWNCSGTSE